MTLVRRIPPLTELETFAKISGRPGASASSDQWLSLIVMPGTNRPVRQFRGVKMTIPAGIKSGHLHISKGGNIRLVFWAG